ncbi:MAG: type IX secretion system membrane protein PorP/SprF [Bacteroidales bacterium]|nr:type IX secretion system membrane protein PorP/SprF [Bacteroidales bacterium]
MYSLNDNFFKIIIFFLLAPVSLTGQVNQFHASDQYMNNPILFNPAYSGEDDALSINISCKNQSFGFEGSPKSTIIAIHTPIQSRNISVGIQLHKQEYAIEQNLILNVDYAYRFNFRNGTLALGLAFNITNYETRWSDLIAYETDDNSLVPYDISGYYSNARIGAYYKTKHFSTGFSALNLIPNNLGDDTYNEIANDNIIQLFYNIGYKFQKGDRFQFSPFLLLRYNQLNGFQADMAMQLFYQKKVSAGIIYRSEGDIISLLQLRINKQISFAYSYGFQTNRNNGLGGTHEILLKYVFKYERKVESLR